MLVMVGGHEILLDDAQRFAERARAAGVDLTLEIAPEMIHIWHVFGPMFPEAEDACELPATFIRSHMQ
jgi:acetyl esterase/lipase